MSGEPCGTLPREFWDLMQCRSVVLPYCAVCGESGHVEQHHMVPRSAGNLFVCGTRLEKPTITLCGFGNASGCHGLAHAHRLHFRLRDGRFEMLLAESPVKRYAAVEMDGWEPVPGVRGSLVLGGNEALFSFEQKIE